MYHEISTFLFFKGAAFQSFILSPKANFVVEFLLWRRGTMSVWGVGLKGYTSLLPPSLVMAVRAETVTAVTQNEEGERVDTRYFNSVWVGELFRLIFHCLLINTSRNGIGRKSGEERWACKHSDFHGPLAVCATERAASPGLGAHATITTARRRTKDGTALTILSILEAL